uniref:Uncharacterized protein n=1 Tax=Trichuris muris TaxID=70415 RepID=A0A5S6QC66_TRIMR
MTFRKTDIALTSDKGDCYTVESTWLGEPQRRLIRLLVSYKTAAFPKLLSFGPSLRDTMAIDDSNPQMVVLVCCFVASASLSIIMHDHRQSLALEPNYQYSTSYYACIFGIGPLVIIMCSAMVVLEMMNELEEELIELQYQWLVRRVKLKQD